MCVKCMLDGVESRNRKDIRFEHPSIDFFIVALFFYLRKSAVKVSPRYCSGYDTKFGAMFYPALLTVVLDPWSDLADWVSSIFVDYFEQKALVSLQVSISCLYFLSTRCEQIYREFIAFDWRFTEAFTFNAKVHW